MAFRSIQELIHISLEINSKMFLITVHQGINVDHKWPKPDSIQIF